MNNTKWQRRRYPCNRDCKTKDTRNGSLKWLAWGKYWGINIHVVSLWTRHIKTKRFFFFFEISYRQFSNVTANDVVGMRAPYLKPGRNTQYKVCKLLFTEIGNDHESNAWMEWQYLLFITSTNNQTSLCNNNIINIWLTWRYMCVFKCSSCWFNMFYCLM